MLGKKLYIVYKNVGQRNLLLFHVLMKFIVFSIRIMHNKMRMLNGNIGREETMGFVSDVLDKTDDSVELYNFLFVDYQIEKINNEINYLDSIRDNAEQIRYYFLNCADTMNMPLKVLYIQNVMRYSNIQLKTGLEQMYQILEDRKNQIMRKKINTEPIKGASNVCKIVEELQNHSAEYKND